MIPTSESARTRAVTMSGSGDIQTSLKVGAVKQGRSGLLA